MINLISVIVPVYNGEKYIRRCIESVINQSYRDIELILINDGSTDKSGQICYEYGLGDNRIRVINTRNNGPAAARNTGIENSRGSFIFFIDSDDLIEINALDLLVQSYHQTGADVIAGDFKIENHNRGLSPEDLFLFPGNKLLSRQDIVQYTRSYLKKPTGHSIFPYAWAKLFRSSIIKDNNIYFNTDLRVFEDISFVFDYLKYSNSAYYVKSRVYKYFVNDSPGSAGMKIYENPLGYKLALKTIGEFLKDNGLDDAVIEKELGHARISFAIRTFIRFFALNDNAGLKGVYSLILNMVNDHDIRNSLRFYSPSKGDSRVLPVLMKLKLILPIILVCRFEFYKKHKKRAVKCF